MTDLADLGQGLTELLNAIPEYQLGERYFRGRPDELFISPRMRRALRNAGTLRLNLAKTPVAAVADRLEIAGITATAPGGGTYAQDTLDTIYKANQLAMELPELFLRALYFGDSYLQLDGDDKTGAELFYNSPLTMRMIYSAENPRVKAFTIKRWAAKHPDGSPAVRVNMIYKDRIERFITSPGAKDGCEATNFVPYTDPTDPTDNDFTVPNAYGFIPCYHFRTARPYGIPVHADAYGPQDAVNKLAVTNMSTVDFQGFPQRWAMMQAGDSTEVDDYDTDPMFDEVSPDGEGPELGPDRQRTSDRANNTGLTADPGGIWWLNGKGTVGQFPAADSKNFIDPMEFYMRVMAQVTTTPMHYFDPSGDMPSGESLRAKDAPLVKRVRRHQLLFGSSLDECLSDSLTVSGVQDAKVSVQWADPSSADDKVAVETAAAKIGLGVPVRQVLRELGYTTTQLDHWNIPADNALAAPAAPPQP